MSTWSKLKKVLPPRNQEEEEEEIQRLRDYAQSGSTTPQETSESPTLSSFERSIAIDPASTLIGCQYTADYLCETCHRSFSEGQSSGSPGPAKRLAETPMPPLPRCCVGDMTLTGFRRTRTVLRSGVQQSHWEELKRIQRPKETHYSAGSLPWHPAGSAFITGLPSQPGQEQQNSSR